MSVRVYGASDDLIEIDGDINEEFNHYGHDPAILGFSNGTVLHVHYDMYGFWRIGRLAGDADIVPASDHDENYSDIAEIDAQISWVLKGHEYVYSREAS